MRRRQTSSLLYWCKLLLCLHAAVAVNGWAAQSAEVIPAPVSPSEAVDRSLSTPNSRVDQAPPQKAYELLERLQERQGEPLPGYIGGRDFHNRERRLPKGRYREYDVNPKMRGRPRDTERIVIEQHTGKAYYTGDHYRTFLALN